MANTVSVNDWGSFKAWFCTPQLRPKGITNAGLCTTGGFARVGFISGAGDTRPPGCQLAPTSIALLSLSAGYRQDLTQAAIAIAGSATWLSLGCTDAIKGRIRALRGRRPDVPEVALVK